MMVAIPAPMLMDLPAKPFARHRNGRPDVGGNRDVLELGA
jgi:hypothetical protein